MISKIGSLMSEEFVYKLFKIGILLIGMAFLGVYFFIPRMEDSIRFDEPD